MVAIYARQSIDKKDSISIDSQIELCKREAFGEEVRTYVDKGFSGKRQTTISSPNERYQKQRNS